MGDSFTFGEEARFEDTWNYYLQQRLGPNCQVINFAVPGYSIGQMYLRLERDILPHDPDLVILGFTDGALDRTLGIYCFLMGLEWPDCPWVAPRFALRDGELVVVNAPLPHPHEIYATKAIYDLPFIAYDRWYHTAEWEQRHWEHLYASYVFRFLTTLYPIYNVVDPEVFDTALHDVNSALFRAFLDLADKNSLRVLIVYLPMMEDYGYKVRYRAPVSHGVLKDAGIDFIDGTTCIAQLEESRRFLATGLHYTPEGERHLAECLLPHVLKQLSAVRPTHGKPTVTLRCPCE
ncbi:SGNH/GDSL hydrolase family protein [Nitrospira tepida]|uniref:SGNH/GDSL hydrolase family protein n=1 Tax=Nitrospira tepida TaxID=2973512 RepID=UPI00259C72E4|nr:SGNH/GDSL hydrolase family protein [Nitrospira tepida]